MAHPFYHHASINRKSRNHVQDEPVSLREPLLWKCIVLAALAYLVWSDKLSIVLDFSASPRIEQRAESGKQKVQASMFSGVATQPERRIKPPVYSSLILPPSARSHCTFVIDPGFAQRNRVDAEIAAMSAAQCREYVARFAPVAVAEMQKFGIPASIILAQGLLESNSGTSKIAKSTNNHFGLKCFSNRCKNGHCMNFTDDSHKDFFIQYSSVWSSYRDHSKLLKNNRRYTHLFKFKPDDFRSWASGLAKAGYASDKNYAEKLVALIINLQLYKYDQA